MVKAGRIFFGGLLLQFCLSAAVTGQTFPDYKIGDVATQEVVTPFPLIVVDSDETKILREKESLRVPAIFRFDPRVAAETEAAFLSILDQKRDQFRDKINSTFDRRTLGRQQIASARFQRLEGNFLRQNKFFLLTTNLLELWARDESDQSIRADFTNRFRAVIQYVREDRLPSDVKIGPQARIVTTANLGKLPDDIAGQNSLLTHRTNVVPLAKARNEFMKSFPSGERIVAKNLVSLIRENCVLEAKLTREARAKKTEALWAADHYEPGQLVLKRGQIVTAKTKAALDQLREKMNVARLEQQVAATNSQVKQNHSLLILIGAGSFVSLLAILLLGRRKRVKNFLPVRLANPGDVQIACPACAEQIVIPLPGIVEPDPLFQGEAPDWKRRALAAEVRAELASSVARTGLISSFGRLLKEKFVAKLLTRNNELASTHDLAVAEIAELEERLRRLNAPLQERLTAYESRIAELETELAARGEENRELIQAKIQITKQQLAAAKETNQMGWN